jgi:hypothetical protein
MRADADTSPAAQKKILASFEKFGVSKEQIEKRIQRKMDAIQPAQVVALRKIHASMKDGMSRPSEWFEDVVASANVPKADVPKVNDSNPKPPLVLDASEVSPLANLQMKIVGAGIEAEDFLSAAQAGGLPVSPDAALVEYDDAVILGLLQSFEEIVKVAKGGQK